MEEMMNAQTSLFHLPTHLRLTVIAAAVATIVGVAIANAPTSHIGLSYEPAPFDGSVIMDLNPHEKTIGGSTYMMYGAFGELSHHAVPRGLQESKAQTNDLYDYED
jgi:hypothetical protein